MTTLLLAADAPCASARVIIPPSAPTFVDDAERVAWIVTEFDRRTAAMPGIKRSDVLRDVMLRAFGLSLSELASRSRKAKLSERRQQFACLMRLLTNTSYEKIGVMIDRDHATVMPAVRKHRDQFERLIAIARASR
jgi:chromosomal replication initiation ATPase DnaA